MSKFEPLVIGAGPAGLAAAFTLGERQIPSLIIEKDKQVGGLCKTVEYQGFRCDIGGHRFFTKNREIQTLWEGVLGNDLLLRQRLSRIYYQGKFFYYPLRAGNALTGLGLMESSRVCLSYFKSQLFRVKPELSFEDWVSNRFGKALYQIFFKTYTEKVWGIPCTELSADWAAQRIRNLSLGQALMKASGLSNKSKVASLIEQFHYPRLGPGHMYETMAERVANNGGKVRTGQAVVEIRHAKSKIIGAQIWEPGGSSLASSSHCFSSMPISELVQSLRPQAPDAVMDAARSLRYRSIISVNLLFKTPTPFPDNWIYLHSTEVRASRVQFYENWSPFMVPQGGHSSVGFEYFCFEGDEYWNSSDSDLIRLALGDLSILKFYDDQDFIGGFVVRYAKAYPLYTDNYARHLSIIREWLSQFSNLYCIGRYGQFRYNNMDHSIMTGILAVRRMLGQDVDPWSVNAEGEYLEEK